MIEISNRHSLKFKLAGLAMMGGCILSSFNAQAHSDLQVPQFDRAPVEESGRIIGGTVVPEGERTFQVALLQNDQQICGGSIVADSWVLTAAHCVTGGPNITHILSGTQNLNQGGQRDSVAQIIPHPEWAQDLGAGSDLALIQINGTFASNLERLKIPTPSIMSSSATPGTAGVVSGWGLTSGGGVGSAELLWTTNTIISDSQCQQVAGNINGDDIICAQDPVRSSCNGDSGGPFTIESGGDTYSAGIVSFGPRFCSGYSAYTETASFNSWISQHIGAGDGDGDGGNENVLSNNESISVTGSQDEMVYYTFELPDGITSYSVDISGGSGDADLYVRKDERPTDFEFDCRPYIDGNVESCSDTSATSGTYHVMLKGFHIFSDVNLVLSYDETGAGDDDDDDSIASCPADHQQYTGSINADGATILDDNSLLSG